MPVKLSHIAFISLLLLASPLVAGAETVLEKVRRTGELTAGARTDAIPFGYIDSSNKKWTGYAVDLMGLIQKRLEAEYKKPIKLNLVRTTIDERFNKVRDRSLDLACGAATITEERLQQVDFSIPYFITGSQFLIRIDEVSNFNIDGTLKNVKIAYIPGTTTDLIIRQIYPFADWRRVNNRESGVEKLEKGEVAAVASDGILLIGEIVKQGSAPRDFALTPQQPMTTELYGCALPKNDPEWKKFVDQTIASEENRLLQKQWFNVKESSFPYRILTAP
ncbi:MAG: Glutamate/aspartate import solute-binding protein [Chroococcopsis gigantea SAG 12.99]|jgi:polar amino acid transport system substrate-binding protein|nr:Glutamate/aspartate import solute-binding protein [Chroococcopsis gigantea SAG 12.99]